MSDRGLSLPKLAFVLVLLLLVGCGVTSVAVPAPTPTATSVGQGAKWDLVFLSDSSGWGVADRYGAYIEQDLGVTVEVHDLAAGGLTAAALLAELRGEELGGRYPRSVDVPGLVRDAEVVVVYGNPMRSRSETHPGDHNLVGSRPYAKECPPETWDAYEADLGAIYDEIRALRGDNPILIRAYDAYNPIYSVYREQGVYDEAVRCWGYYNDAIRRAAEANGVPLARVYDAFNGPNHDEDPREKGYIGADGSHTIAAGREVISDLLRDLGYE